MLRAELRPLGACSEWRGSGLSGDAQGGCTRTKLLCCSPQKGEFGEERAASSKVRQEQSSTSRTSGAGGERHEPTRIALAKKKPHGNGELQQGVGADGFPIKISPQLLPGPQKKKKKITNPTWLTHQQPCYKTSRGSISRSGS